MYIDYHRQRTRDYITPVENKLEIRKEIEEATEEYLRNGGKISRVEGYGWETITRADIGYRWRVSDSFIAKAIARKKFPISLSLNNGTGSKGRDRRQDRYLLGEVEEFFKNLSEYEKTYKRD